MEIQFHKTICPYLQQLKRELLYQEQTQEIRLPDGMPDVGRVIGAWGQPLVRSKEWRSGGMGISGGVMAWVLYEPEEGGAPRGVEAWLPFQLKWELPDSERDGTIHGTCLLKSVDARTTSARKLIVRATVGIVGEAFVPGQVQIPSPEQLPEDIQLLEKEYSLRLPMESGERHFEIEEDLKLPGSMPTVDRLLYYTIQPEITEQKVMAGKVVFRGGVILHLLYSAEDGTLHSTDFDFPFSMYSDLDRDYNEDATAWICPIVTGLELDKDPEGKLRLKAGLAGQYVIYDRQNIQVVEDAYSPNRNLKIQLEQLQLPMILDDRTYTLRAEQSTEMQGRQVVDTVFYVDHPRMSYHDASMETELPGYFQMLYYDDANVLQFASPRWNKNWTEDAVQDLRQEMSVFPTGRPLGTITGGNADMCSDVLVCNKTVGQQGIPAISALEIAEQLPVDANRPSLLLRRYNEDSLWHLAKKVGTTVEAIKSANRLQAEPERDQIILIPIP